MTLSEKITYTKIKKLNENDSRCEVCGKLMSLADCQLAHRIPKTKYNLKTYGKTVLHHEYNLAAVCSLRCNSAVLLSPATHPLEAAELIERIWENLRGYNKNPELVEVTE